jgi:hypothetical protein
MVCAFGDTCDEAHRVVIRLGWTNVCLVGVAVQMQVKKSAEPGLREALMTKMVETMMIY